MAIQRTTPGSYEAPVQGVVDYGAFQRGFNSAFIVPQPEEEKDPLEYDDPDGTYVTTVERDADTPGMRVSERSAQQLNKWEEDFLGSEKNNYMIAAKGQDQKKINELNKMFETHANDINTYQEAKITALSLEQAGDPRFPIPFATNDKGEFLTIFEYFGKDRQNKGNWSYNVIRRGNRTITQEEVDGFKRTITGLNKNNITNYMHPKFSLNTELAEYANTVRGKMINLTSADYETNTTQTTAKGATTATTTTITTNKLRTNVLNQIQSKAEGFAADFLSTATPEAKSSLYADILYGENNKENFDKKQSGGYIQGYEGGVFTSKILKDKDGNAAKFTFEQFANGKAPDAVRNELIKDYLVNYHKTNASDGAFKDPNFNNHPVLASDLEDTKTAITPIDPKETSEEKTRENLLGRTRSLMDRVNINTYTKDQIKNAIAKNQINVANVGAYTIPAGSVGVSFKEGKKFPTITIKPFKAKGNDGKMIDVPAGGPFDLNTADGIENYMKSIYGTTSDTGRAYSNIYLPVAQEVLKSLTPLPQQ